MDTHLEVGNHKKIPSISFGITKLTLIQLLLLLFQMCSPAKLRQQTEELCAAIDQVLQDPLPMVIQH